MSSVPKPNYTQIPNLFLDDIILEMQEAEIRVVLAICRQTFGWHRKRKLMSLSYLMKATGMSKQGVINGVSNAITRGIVRRRKSGQSWQYEIVISDKVVNQVVNQVDKQLVNEVDHLGIKVVNQVDTSKEKGLKKGNSKKESPINNNNIIDASKKSQTVEEKAVVVALLDSGILESSHLKITTSFKEKKERDLEAKDILAWLEYISVENLKSKSGLSPGFIVAKLCAGELAPGQFYDMIDEVEDIYVIE